MERLTYILDTNAVADYINEFVPTITRIKQAIREDHLLILCQPVRYEVMRGLLKVGATRKQEIFEQEFTPRLMWIPLVDADWEQAARFWADATSRGRQFSDIDLLVAAVASRLEGVIVSSDADFDALAISREDWRNPPQST
jgi:predicted nucleic acid-binding protein